jgi:DNA-binding NtrC family response regulator
VAKQTDEKAPKILLTFTGFHDPFSTGAIAGIEQEGPVLSLARAFPVDQIVLFATPGTREITQATEEAVRQRHPTLSVKSRSLPLEDPTDYTAILRGLRGHFSELTLEHPQAQYFIATASGTPQMHACWVLLAASGELPARLLHLRPPRFVTSGRPAVSEVDLSHAAFPTIRPPRWLGPEAAEDDARAPQEVMERLGIVGNHPALTRAIETAGLLSASDVPVLILGESGTGKELVAALIHQLSGRAGGPFVTVNCAAVPEQLAESVLFGHRKGAFTGAVRDQQGKFEEAAGGTLFLDELGELSLEVQAKLLRAVQDGTVEPLGESRPRKIDVRLVGATNRDLVGAIARGEFREDLYYRLSVGEVRLPALRDRRSDIPSLAVHFLDLANQRLKRPKAITPEGLSALLAHPWPGNVRELSNVIQRATLLTRGQEIRAEDLDLATPPARPADTIPQPAAGFSVEAHLKETRKALFERALEIAEGNQSEAARLLGVTPQAVFKFLRGQGG